MQLRLDKIVIFIACLVFSLHAGAQHNTHYVTGTITEKVIAELWVNKLINGKYQRIAGYKLSPDNGNFVFTIPKDTGVDYRLQINLYKPGGRHPKMDKILALPLNLNAGLNYSLKITPSKFDTIKKTGWVLKQDAGKSSIALIRGKIVNVKFNGLQVNLQHVVNGTLVSRNSFITNKEGEFEIPCQVKQEGFYYLSTMRWTVRVYLRPAEQLELNIDGLKGVLVSIKGGAVNQLLYQWEQLISPVTSYGYNLTVVTADSIDVESYINSYEKLQPAMDEFIESVDMTDARTLALVQNAMRIDRELVPINFLYHLSAKNVNGFRASPKDFNEVPVFYQRFLQPGKFSSASLLSNGETRHFMNLYTKLNVALLPKEKREALSQGEKLKLMMNTISNDTLKSFFFNDQMGQIEVSNLSEFTETFVPFKQYAKWAPAKTTYQNIHGLYAGDTAYIGKSSYNFSLPDTNGNMVSMKDFKGKVVFIDVWATWCGPCKAQFPFLQELEKEYHHNKDIVFVGISLDKTEAKQKWLNTIRKENLGGIQLLDDFGKAFGRKYEIAAIPRFLLIDRQGKWIEIRCPLPEAKERLRNYLDKALEEKDVTRK
ncbi:MAG TPA: TlpA disulfide reductase family protein [Flavitalea sp.]|nr:TlpA disulfide reductase family protein [Flavitalea sp.]